MFDLGYQGYLIGDEKPWYVVKGIKGIRTGSPNRAICFIEGFYTELGVWEFDTREEAEKFLREEMEREGGRLAKYSLKPSFLGGCEDKEGGEGK